MRQHTPLLPDVLTGSFTRRVTVNVFHGRDRVETGLAFESWSFDGDLGARLTTSGVGTVVYPSVNGESMSPVGTKGVLSPFRARVELVMEILAGSFRESVSLGMFRVTRILEARDHTTVVGGVERVVASRVRFEFVTLEADVERRGFRFPEVPSSTDSAFEEIRRVTGMPVRETVDDAAITGDPVWEAKQGGRLDAVRQLGGILGGTAVVDSLGSWVVIPDQLGDPVGELTLGERGTVLDVGAEIDTDTVYNVVVGLFEDENRTPFYSVAEVPNGDLAPGSNYLENTRYYSSEFVKTQAQGDSAVASVLALSIGSQQYDVTIQCHINPLVELGDVLALSGWSRPIVGQLVKFGMSESPLMNVTLRVAREL